MKDLKIGVFDPRAVEIWGGECPSMEGSGILTISFASHSYQVSIFSDAMVRNEPSCLGVSFLVKEDDRVKVRLCTIVLYPPFARVIGILKVAGEGRCKVNGFRWGSGPGNSRLVLSEPYWFIAVDTVIAHVWFREV